MEDIYIHAHYQKGISAYIHDRYEVSQYSDYLSSVRRVHL